MSLATQDDEHPRSMEGRPSRRRRLLLPVLFLLPPLGLMSRSHAAYLPQFVVAYAGDTLWATLAYFCFVFLRPRWSIPQAAAIALAFSFLVEFSQLYHTPWLDAVRANRFGALLLGRGFLASDLVCYTAGVVLAMGVDRLLPRAPLPA